MENCRFCGGKWVNADRVGDGIRTMATNLDFLFMHLTGDSLNDSEQERDGIHLVNGNMLAYDNSSGEYAEQMIEVNYCPLCGMELKAKEDA